MRTVSFSDRRVQNQLNRHFVNTYTDLTGDPTAGSSFKHRPSDPVGSCIRGNGKQNVQTVFLTPDGEIFHVATGFLSPDDLLQEITFARQLFSRLNSGDSQADRIVADTHRKRLAEEGFSDASISSPRGMELMDMIRNNQFAGSNPAMNSPNGVFSGFIKTQFLSDNKFCIEHPLLPAESLERNPALLVGNGKSFFGSSSSSNNGGTNMPRGNFSNFPAFGGSGTR